MNARKNAILLGHIAKATEALAHAEQLALGEMAENEIEQMLLTATHEIAEAIRRDEGPSVLPSNIATQEQMEHETPANDSRSNPMRTIPDIINYFRQRAKELPYDPEDGDFYERPCSDMVGLYNWYADKLETAWKRDSMRERDQWRQEIAMQEDKERFAMCAKCERKKIGNAAKLRELADIMANLTMCRTCAGKNDPSFCEVCSHEIIVGDLVLMARRALAHAEEGDV